MAQKSCKGNVYNNVKEVLDMLRVDEDSDEEDFSESQTNYKNKNNREIDEQELEDLDTGLSSLPPNKDLQRPSVSQHSQIFSRDGTIWNKEPPCTPALQSKRYILSTKPGTKRFTLACVNDENDVFQELWKHQNLKNVMHFTLAKARRGGDKAFSLSKDFFVQVYGIFWPVHTPWCAKREKQTPIQLLG